MATDGIQRPSDCFFLRLNFASWEAARRGIRSQNALFHSGKAHFSPDLRGLNCLRHQIPHPHEVVSSSCESKNPSDFVQTPMPSLVEDTHRLDPAENLFDPLPFSLTHLATVMSCRASVNRAAARSLVVLRNMRRHIHAPHLLHEVFRIVCFIACQRDALCSLHPFRHQHSRIPLYRAAVLS